MQACLFIALFCFVVGAALTLAKEARLLALALGFIGLGLAFYVLPLALQWKS